MRGLTSRYGRAAYVALQTWPAGTGTGALAPARAALQLWTGVLPPLLASGHLASSVAHLNGAASLSCWAPWQQLAGFASRSSGGRVGRSDSEPRPDPYPTAGRARRTGAGGARDLTPQELTGRIRDATGFEELQFVLDRHAASMNHINWSAAFVRTAKLQRGSWQSLQQKQQLADRIWQQGLQSALERCGAREASNLIHGMAAMQHCPPGMLPACFDRFMAEVSAASPQAVSNVVWAVARLLDSGRAPGAAAAELFQGADSSSWLGACLDRLTDQLSAVKPQEMSSTLWAAAKLSGAGGAPSEAVAAVFAGGRSGWLAACVARLVAQLSATREHELCVALWALAKLLDARGAPGQAAAAVAADERLMQQLLHGAALAAPSMAPQGVSSSTWAASQLRVCSEPFASAMQQAARRRLHDFKPQELANMAYGAAILAWPGADRLVAELLEAAAGRLQQGAGISQQGSKQQKPTAAAAAGFKHQHLSNLCWAAFVAGLGSGELQHVLVLCGALAQHWEQPLQSGTLAAAARQQLWQLAMSLHAIGPDPAATLPLSPQQLQQCEAAWLESQASARQQAVTSTEQQVREALEGAGVQLVGREVPVGPLQLLSIDILAQHGSTQLAVEADGPTHFVRWLAAEPDGSVSSSYRFTGDTAWRNTMLRHSGYTVVSVPHFELYHKSKEAKREVVRHLVAEAVAAAKQPA